MRLVRFCFLPLFFVHKQAFHSRIIAPVEIHLIEDNWVGRSRSATTQSIAVENEPEGVQLLISDSIETHEQFQEMAPRVTDWLKKK
jgi:hypothetical protein